MSTLKVDGIRSNSATSDAIALASDGTCTAKLKSIAGGQLAGFRNLVINGNMKVHQRAQSVTGVTNGYRTADRFYIRRSVANTTFNSSVANGVLTVNNPSASTAFDVRHGIEWDDAFYGKTMTISFNATAAVGSVDFSVGVVDGSVGATTASVAAHLTGTTTDVSDIAVSPVSGTKYEITVDIPADGDVSFTPDMLRLGFGTVSADASQSFTLSNVQCEFGSVATEFEHRSFGQELALCQRYYQSIRFGAYGAFNFIGRKSGSGTCVGRMVLGSPMRAAATGTVTSAGGFSLYRVKDGSSASSSAVVATHTGYTPYNVVQMTATVSTFSTGDICTMTNGATAGHLKLDAEL